MSPRPAAAPADVRELLVLWQEPNTREIIPIGRLGHTDGGFRFTYTNRAASLENFRPLRGLVPVGMTYEEPVLPAIFRQRVMASDRPDFATYVRQLGLTPDTATPWEQIVQSGGTRSGDTLQFMEVPTVTSGIARTRFLVSGVRHIPEEQDRVMLGQRISVSSDLHEATLTSIREGSAVSFVPEDDNEADASAVFVVSPGGVPVGWVPRFLAPSFREIDSDVAGRVVRVNGPDAPSHLRLVVELNRPVRPGFSFDPEGQWEPFSSEVG